MRKCVIAAIAIVLLSCSDVGLSPEERDFNILFKFGVTAHNELNTFENSYTKDLILDGTITVTLVLSQYELRAIEAKLLEIDFFSYPADFKVVPPPGVSIGMVTPALTYYMAEYWGRAGKDNDDYGRFQADVVVKF